MESSAGDIDNFPIKVAFGITSLKQFQWVGKTVVTSLSGNRERHGVSTLALFKQTGLH